MNTEVMFSTGQDEYSTPQDLYEIWDRKYKFTLDPCATHENHKCEKYYTKAEDGLKQSWKGEIVFMNPPYSRKTKTNPGQEAWIKKAFEESGNGAIVVGLLPARTDTIAFRKYILGQTKITFIKGRLKFGNSKDPAPFPSMIVEWTPYHKGVKR
jgi:phage N-6-adenine-methyltransferase